MAPGIGISEIIFIVLVALVVIKPERLPGTAAKLVRVWRELTGYVGGIKSALNKELMEIQKLDAIKDLKSLADPANPEDPLGLKGIREETSKIAGAAGEIADEFHSPESVYPELRKEAGEKEKREPPTPSAASPESAPAGNGTAEASVAAVPDGKGTAEGPVAPAPGDSDETADAGAQTR
ncbi:MAG: hypothetical protein LBF41_06075, partial [Deltaproteobacteria bacterium]|nr:hypothetical protein [Deltaproteobacteria bacterium]